MERLFPSRCLVMITQHANSRKGANDFQALGGIGIVTHDIAKAVKLRASIGTGIGQHGLKSLEIGVNIAKDCRAHQREGGRLREGRLVSCGAFCGVTR